VAVAAATAPDRRFRSRALPGLTNTVALPRDGALLLVGLAISAGIVVGMFLESGTLMLVAALAAFGAGIINPALGLVVLAFMGPLNPPPAIPAPGFDIILVAAILFGCLYRLPTSRIRLRLSPPLLLLLAFVFYAFAQQLPDMATGYAGTQAHDVGFLFYQLLTGLGTIVAAGFVLRGRSPYPFLVALMVSATLAALLGIVTADGVPYARLANLMPPPDVASRATGPFGNPNSFGQLLAYASALAAGWFAATHSSRVRAGLLAAIGIMGWAVSLSLSRGAVATLLAGVVALAFARRRALGFVAVAIALGVVIVLTNEAGSASSAAAAQLAASDQGRLDAILAGPELFAMSPIFGIGFGQYKYLSALVTDQGAGLVAHNWYGTVLAEQGLLGIVLWVMMLVAVWRWLRSRPARPRSIGFAMLGAAIVGCLFLEPPTSFQTSVLPAIVLTTALVGDWNGHTRSPAPGRRTKRVEWSRHPVEAAGGFTSG
jgi:O-antigen ligase